MIKLSQRDLRWKDIKLGTSDLNIGNAGCTISALASILESTPDVVNQRLIDGKGYSNKNLVTWSKLTSIFPQIKEARRVVGYNNTEVLANIPCLVEVDGSPIGAPKHWVVYIGNKQLMDPWIGNIRETGFYRPTGYAIIKISEESSSSMDIRLQILNENNIKNEGDLRETIGASKELPGLKEDKLNADKEIERLRHLVEQDKSDLKAESDANTALKLAHEDHLESIGKAVGNGPDLPGILQHISLLSSKADLADKYEKELLAVRNNNADLKADISRKEDAIASYSLKVDSLASEAGQIKEILSKWLKIATVTPESLLAALRGHLGVIEKPLVAKVVEYIKSTIKKYKWRK